MVDRFTVLVVDDELENRDFVERALVRYFTVLKAESSVEAMEILRDNRVDVVVADQRMPEGTGVALLERLQELRPWVGRILLTAYGDQEVLADAINRARADRYLAKPVDVKTLCSTVEAVLKLREAFSEEDYTDGDPEPEC